MYAIRSYYGLVLADYLDWQTTFAIVGSFMLIGIGMTLAIAEVSAPTHPESMRRALVDPFKDFLARKGWRNNFV